MTQPEPALDLADRSLISRWYEVVDRQPAAVAVRTLGGQTLTFKELDEASSRVANQLLSQFGDPSFPVLLLLDQSPELIAAILGVIKANKLFVVLDPGQPAAYLKRVAEVTRAGVLLCAGAYQDLARSVRAADEPVWLFEDIGREGSERPADGCTANSIAGLVFTSGSTGQPKGVIYPHKMLAHRVWSEERLGLIGPGHKLAGLRHCGFSAGVADLFKALLSGASYHLFPVQAQGVHALSRWLRDECITYLPLPVVLFRQWLDILTPSDSFPTLTRVYPSGRKSMRDAERLWPHVGPDCLLLSTYGSTEASLMSLAMVSPTAQEAPGVLDVGLAVPGKRISIVGADGLPVQPGETGEIEIQSAYISPGYWRQPELTRQGFRPAGAGSAEQIYATGDLGRLRSDGALELIGRTDSQVKVRGFRVLLEEVEHEISTLPGVKEAAVTLDEEKDRLLAYVVIVGGTGSAPTISGLRETLSQRLPDHAVPARWVVLDAFPLLPSGKVNRRALPRPGRDRPASQTLYQSPSTPTEARLADIWAHLLGFDRDALGRLDHFFELGGHSLLATRLLVEVEKGFGVRVLPRSFLRDPTLAHLACLIDRPADAATPAREQTPNLPANTTGIRLHQIDDVFDLPEDFIRKSKPARLKMNWDIPTRILNGGLAWAGHERAAALVAWLARGEPGRKLAFRDKVPMLVKFHRELKIAMELEEFLTRSLSCYAIDRYKIGVPGRRGGTKAHVTGTEALQESARAGRDVLLVRSHDNARFWFGPARLTDYRATQASHLLGRIDNPTPLDETALYVHQLDTAIKHLRAGDVVEIHGDGNQGTSAGWMLPFLGRRRRFLGGFAELAALTDAPVFLVDASLEPPGNVTLRLVGPLDAGDPGKPHELRVQTLLTQYVDWMTRKWTQEPWMVPLFDVEAYLTLPTWTEPDPSFLHSTMACSGGMDDPVLGSSVT